MTEQYEDRNAHIEDAEFTESTEQPQISQEEMQEMFNQLHEQHFMEQYGPIFDTLLEMRLENGNYYNVNRSTDGEWRCAIVNGDKVKDCFVAEDGYISQQEFKPEEGDKVLWIAHYNAGGRHVIVQTGNATEDFKVLHDGDLRSEYNGDDLGYVINFLAGIGSTNYELMKEGDKEKFEEAGKLVRNMLGDKHPPLVHFLVSLLMRVKEPKEFLKTWDEATVLNTGDEIEYGIRIKARDEKISESTLSRMIIWENPIVLDEQGNRVEEEKTVVSTRVVPEQAVPAIINNTDVNYLVKHKVPDYWKAILVVTEDHLSDDGLQPIALYKREGFNPLA